MIVVDLIDLSTGSWCETRVRKVLLPCDIEAILDLRLSDNDICDDRAWFFKRHGNFSVKFAFHMLMNVTPSESVMAHLIVLP